LCPAESRTVATNVGARRLAAYRALLLEEAQSPQVWRDCNLNIGNLIVDMNHISITQINEVARMTYSER